MAALSSKNAANGTKKPKKATKSTASDGTAHLIDSASINQSPEVVCFIKRFNNSVA